MFESESTTAAVTNRHCAICAEPCKQLPGVKLIFCNHFRAKTAPAVKKAAALRTWATA